MAKISHLMAGGMSAAEALRVVGGNFSAGGQTATGTTKATATLLTEVDSYVAICSASGKGVELAQMDQGDDMCVFNGGANTVHVYSNGTDVIINHSANQPFPVGSMKGCWFNKVSSTIVMVNLSA